MRNIVLSIHPECVEKILSGEKSFEYRKELPKDELEYVLIYSTSPIKKIVAIGVVDCVLHEKLYILWNKTFGASGIEESVFKKYFRNKEYGYAIKFKQIYRLNNPIDLKSINCNYPPQLYFFYNGDIKQLIKNSKKIQVKNKLIFLGGVHGTGKTTYANNILSAYGYNCVSASELIRQYKGEVNLNKTVSKIEDNQLILLAAIKKYQRGNYKVVIDGHFCIINTKGVPENISIEVFKEMKPELLLLAEIPIEQLQKNLNQRAVMRISVSLSDFVLQEHQQAEFVSKEIGIPMRVINTFKIKKTLINDCSNFLQL